TGRRTTTGAQARSGRSENVSWANGFRCGGMPRRRFRIPDEDTTPYPSGYPCRGCHGKLFRVNMGPENRKKGLRKVTVLGIDVGGSGIKGAPVDIETGKLVDERHRIATPQPATPESVAAVIGEISRHFH